MNYITKIVVLIVFLAFHTSNKAEGQIVLEHDYDSSAAILKHVHFQINGDKYARLSYPRVLGPGNYYYYPRQIDIYNLNHSLWKTIPLSGINFLPDTVHAQYGLLYLTDSLFNSDPLVEFLFTRLKHEYSTGTWVNDLRTYVYDENTNVLFTDSIAGPWYTDQEIPQTYLPIVNTANGTKMILNAIFDPSFKARVYGLPGSLSTSLTGPDENYSDNIQGMNLFPNPATNFTTIQYNLPQNVSDADLLIYDLNGRQIKSFKIDHAFNDLILSTEDLSSGSYYFQLQAGKTILQGKKFIKVK